MLILKKFLYEKLSRYFPRKTCSNLRRQLQFLSPRPIFPSILTLCVIYNVKTAILRKTPYVKLKAYVMLILSIFLFKKSSKYFLRKTNFKLLIFEFAAVWSPLPPTLPPARVAEYTLTVQKGVSTLCRSFRVVGKPAPGRRGTKVVFTLFKNIPNKPS
jgi:uncharacterized membrane protein YjgN (DUF898 family)